MNYYLPRYDLPLVLGYTGPGLYFYSPSSENINNLIPSFSKQEDLLAKSKNLEDQTSIKKLYNTCPKYLKPIIALAVCTGMRKGEILNLKWPDVDFRRRIITILETKSQKKREIPIGIGVSRLLLKQRKHQDSPYIFCHKNDRPIGSFRKAFGKALKKIGIQDFTFHDLRHTFASHLVMSGVDLKTVQEIMGHGSFKTTLRYVHLAQDHKRRAMEVFDSHMDTKRQNRRQRRIAAV